MGQGAGGDFGGTIQVILSLADGRVGAVQIESSRPENSAQVLCGRSPVEAVSSLGLVFSLCGRAQTMAGLSAVEQAQGLSVAPPHLAARTLLRLAEMLSQTALRVCLDWPRLLGVEPRPEVVRACLSAETAFERALFKTDKWKVPGGIAFAPDLTAVRAVAKGFEDLLGEDFAAALRDALSAHNLEGFGRLPDGMACEDGALSRRWDADRVRSARERHGAALLARLEARLADLEALLGDLNRTIEALAPGDACAQTPALDGRGRARVETARGWLEHAVILQDGAISAYDISAPTEANFAPDGPVAVGLLGVDAGEEAELKRATELHVLAIDPCVEFGIEVGHA